VLGLYCPDNLKLSEPLPRQEPFLYSRMINIDGIVYPVVDCGFKVVSSPVPGYAVLDAIDVRLYHYEPSCSMVLASKRYARKSDNDYTQCTLSVRGFSVTAARRLTSSRGYVVCMPAIIRCLDHEGCCDSHENVFIYSEGTEPDKLAEIVRSIWIKLEKG